MTQVRFIWLSLTHHWRSNLAVWCGVVIATAVLTGALFVGDSVRGSLRALTELRLGRIDFAVHSPRFFREQLAADLSQRPEIVAEYEPAIPAILVTATGEHRPSHGALTRAGHVQLCGVDERFWKAVDAAGVSPPDGTEITTSSGLRYAVVINERLARQLRVKTGDDLTFYAELPATVPRESLLGKRDETSVQLDVRVTGVLPERSSGGHFGLLADQQSPLNAFVHLPVLQKGLGLGERRPTRADPTHKPARVNALFLVKKPTVVTKDEPAPVPSHQGAADPSPGSPLDPITQAAMRAHSLDNVLQQAWRLDDLHLRLVPNTARGYAALESEQMILEEGFADAAFSAAKNLTLPHAPSHVFLINEIRKPRDAAQRDESESGNVKDDDAKRAPDTDSTKKSGGKPEVVPRGISRYSVVAGVPVALFDPVTPAPFGGYTFRDPVPSKPLSAGTLLDNPDGVGEIVLTDWVAEDLAVGVGDLVEVAYHLVGSHGELPEETRRFRVQGVLALKGTVADDKGLTPTVPGITNVKSFDEWDKPFPMKKVTERDDDYWDRYRATPKMYVSLETAQHLWRSRYGHLTSLRIAPRANQTLDEAAALFEKQLLRTLTPQYVGLGFQAVRAVGLQAASGPTDFAGLFLGFSLFLIVSATILVAVLFRLGIERRAAEVGVLLAVGVSSRTVRTLLLSEALILVLLGTMAGTVAARLYAQVMVYGLTTWWVGAIQTQLLELHTSAFGAVLGTFIATATAMGAVWFGLRGLVTIPVPRLLAGVAQPQIAEAHRTARAGRSLQIAVALSVVSLLLVAGVLVGLIPDREAFPPISFPVLVFFLAGMLGLTSAIVGLAAWIDTDGKWSLVGSATWGTLLLGLKNTARHRSRTVLTTALIATATFLIVAIAAGHRNPVSEQPDLRSGNGGFTLVAESAVPVIANLNTEAGRTALQLDGADAAPIWPSIRDVISFRVQPGENASCLNIYKTSQPMILGVPSAMRKRGGFKFAGVSAADPWGLLEVETRDGEPIPVFGDLNTLQYSMHKGPGSIITLRDEKNRPFEARVSGMFDSSVFQGMLLMSEREFLKRFPGRAGYGYFLIDTPLAQTATVSSWLESKLPGFDAEPVGERLRNFLAVQNTYLSTFQALGALGLLLGTLGQGTVLLRNVLERRRELALLRAVGFPERRMAWLILSENEWLLGWGLVSGTVWALVAMLPQLRGTGADVPWRDVAVLLALVQVVGTAAAWFALRAAVRTPIVSTLRSEG